MKAIDYINSLIKERDELKSICKQHSETVRSQKREIINLKNSISKKDKKIQEFENDSFIIKTQMEIESVKNELDKLKISYSELKSEYDEVLKNKKTQRGKSELSKLKSEYNTLKGEYDRLLKENAEYKSIFDEIENICENEQK